MFGWFDSKHWIWAWVEVELVSPVVLYPDHQGRLFWFAQVRGWPSSPACGSWQGTELMLSQTHAIEVVLLYPYHQGQLLTLPWQRWRQLTWVPKPSRGGAGFLILTPWAGTGSTVPMSLGPALLHCPGKVRAGSPKYCSPLRDSDLLL